MVNSVDVYVGKRIRQFRWIAGFSQQELGDTIGLNFQQIQKYETAANRVSASKLWEISRALNVPVGHFFAGLRNSQFLEEIGWQEIMSDYRAMMLVSAYFNIPDQKRRALYDLAVALGANQKSPNGP